MIWLLVGAVALPAAILFAGSWIAWKNTWREARIELAREAEAAAEYAARLLLTYGIATSRMDDLLRGLSDADIRDREAELHAALKALVADLPEAPAACIIDRDATILVAAQRLPVRDQRLYPGQDFFEALRAPNAPTVHVSEVFLNRFDGRYYFSVGRRRSGTGNPPAPDGFDGLVNVSVQPSVMAEGLRRLVAMPRDVIALIRADGAVLARSVGPPEALLRLPADSRFHAAAGTGVQATVMTTEGMVTGDSELVALRRLESFPLYSAAIRPRAAILAAWWHAVLPQLAIGLPAMLALFSLGLLIRRSQLRLIAAHAELESRVAERTAALAEVSEALDLTPCMVTSLDNGRILHWSAGCVRLYGYSREEALGQPVAELLKTEFPPGGRKAVIAAVFRLGQWQGEVRQRRRDGSTVIAGTQWTLRHDPRTGEPVSLVSTRTDVSALRRAERALSRTEARLRRAQEASGAVAFEIDEDGAVVAGAALPGLFGLPPQTPLTIEHFFTRLRPADRETVTEIHRQLAHEGGAFTHEFRVTWPDGTERWLMARGEAEPAPEGGSIPRLVAGIILDVTERRAAEAALAESGERLRLAQAAAGFGIYDCDFTSRAITWDARMRALWALPEDVPVSNRLVVAALHPGDRSRRREAVRRALAPEGPGTYQVEYRVIGLTDGVERWIAATGQVRFASGRPVRLTGLAMDITERKRAEQRNELLMREVDHRAKNALAVVQAALRLSRAESPAELVRIVEGRVAALARAQTILAQRRWEGAELQALLTGELAPFLTGAQRDAPRAELSGPPVTVAAHAAQPLCMAVHELATNALKYGALSVRGGLLQVTWRVDAANRALVLTWRESGGPAVPVVPGRRGFGSRVIEQTVQGQLGGAVSRRWLPGGLLCELVVPLARTEPGGESTPEGEPQPKAAAA